MACDNESKDCLSAVVVWLDRTFGIFGKTDACHVFDQFRTFSLSPGGAAEILETVFLFATHKK